MQKIFVLTKKTFSWSMTVFLNTCKRKHATGLLKSFHKTVKRYLFTVTTSKQLYFLQNKISINLKMKISSYFFEMSRCTSQQFCYLNYVFRYYEIHSQIFYFIIIITKLLHAKNK
ncbi:hypothetical protein T03_1882 [Trichinella britovi]|uniref:Uncharacterized protein n=1 Tax=Trichinella britovi TaxID=45882 RepID=A0A0V1CKM6_TRIBR|nr:hypothetical protein T03_1882 [Trichinella britovi]